MQQGTPIGPFTLRRPLGAGAMGQVWEARHDSGLDVALKLLRGTVDQRARAAFQHEVRAVAKLAHPAVVRVHDFGTLPDDEGGAPWLAMELADGTSRMAAHRPIDWAGVRELLDQLLGGLAHCHARGVIHRDIKPANLLRCGDRWVLADFGIADLREAGAAARSAGTPRYMAPEQVRGAYAEFGPWTDLYALGIVLWELTTSAVPFACLGVGGHKAHVSSPLPRFQAVMDVPSDLEGVLRRMLTKDPAERYPFAAHVGTAVTALGPPVPVIRPRTAASSPPPPTGDETWNFADMESLPVEDTGDLFDPEAAPLRWPDHPSDWRGRQWAAVSAPRGLGTGLLRHRRAPLIGREAERDRLWQSIAEAAEGPRLVVLEGPAGAGKSALARWLTERAHELGLQRTLVAVHAPWPGATDGLGPMLARHLRLTNPNLSAEMLDAQLIGAGLHSEGMLAAGRAMAQGDADSLPGSMRNAVLGRVLAERARHHPALLWLDDLQWGAAAMELAAHLLRGVVPVLIVATVRSGELAALPAARAQMERLLASPRTQHLTVDPLPPEDTARLLAQLVGLPSELARRVVERTEGNPLFALELLEDWVRRDLLVPSGGGYDLREGADRVLPDRLAAVWTWRLDAIHRRFGERGRAALEIAAALGKEVAHDEWREALGGPPPDGLLDALTEAQLVSADPARPADVTVFAHGLLQASVLEQAAARGSARAAHLACAEALRRLGPDTHHGRVGHHLLAAGEPERAIEPLLQGANRALRGRGRAEAQGLLAAAEPAVAALPPEDERRCLHAQVAGRIELMATGDTGSALARFRAASEAGDRFGWREVALVKLLVASTMTKRGDLDGALAWLEDCRPADPPGDGKDLRASWYQQRAVVYLNQGRLEACHADLVYALSVPTLDRVRLDTLALYGDVLGRLGRIEQAEAQFAEVFRLSEAGGRLGKMASVRNTLGDLASRRGDVDTAVAHYDAAGALYRAAGSANAMLPVANRALLQLREGRPADARQGFEAALAEMQRQGRLGFVATMHSALLPCVAALDDWQAWDHHAGEALRLTEQTGYVDGDAGVLCEQAAERAEQRGQGARAAAGWSLAAFHFEKLGRSEDLARVRARQT